MAGRRRYPMPPPLVLPAPVAGRYGAVYGAQRPRLASLRAGLKKPEAPLTPAFVELGEACGITLAPWERWVLGQVLRRLPGGEWENPELWLLVCRRNGKNVLLKVLELGVVLLLDDMPRISHSAHELRTAKDHLTELHRHLANLGQGFFDEHQIQLRTANDDPRLDLVVRGIPKRIRAIARTNDGGRGGETDLLVVDEALKLTSQQQAALSPLTMATPYPLTVYTSSQAYESGEVLHAQRNALMDGDFDPKMLAWLEWSAPPGSQADDAAALALANPSLGYLFGLDRLERARQTMRADPRKFLVEHMGILEEAQAALPEIDGERWSGLATDEAFPEGPLALGIDRSPRGTDTALVAAAMRPDGAVQVEKLAQRFGDPMWVIPVVRRLVEEGDVRAVVIDPKSTAAVLAGPLRDAGVTVTTVSLGDVTTACQDILDDVLAARLRHPGDIATNGAVLAGVRRVVNAETGAWAWSRLRTSESITILVALTLARWGLTAQGVKAPAPRVRAGGVQRAATRVLTW